MKNKILSIFLIVILISFCFINSVFAVTTNVPESFLNLIYNTEDYKSGNYFLMVTENDTTKYKVYFIPKNDNLKVYCDGSKIYFNPSVSGVKVYGAGDTGLGSLIGTYSFSSEKYMHDSSNLFFAEFDVYTDSTYSDFFFDTPTVLFQVLEKVEMTQEITTTIVGLAKLLIPLLVCLIGFWKAWQALSKQLHKA